MDDFKKLVEKSIVKKAHDIPLVNRKRFTSGIDELDDVYGETKYIHTESSANNQIGDPLIVNGKQFVEKGLPSSFISIWGGAPGSGKSRLAITLSKAMNKKGYKVLYFNGEADENDFRFWIGQNVDKENLLVYSADLIETKTVCEETIIHKPQLVIIDSFQMLLEFQEGLAKTKEALMELKNLKNNDIAQNPHILIISQLNKKNQLDGFRIIEQLADFVANVSKQKDGSILFECPRKNRGGLTPKSVEFISSSDSLLVKNDLNFDFLEFEKFIKNL